MKSAPDGGTYKAEQISELAKDPRKFRQHSAQIRADLEKKYGSLGGKKKAATS